MMQRRGVRIAFALVLGLVSIAPPLRHLGILGFVRARSEAPSMVRRETRPHHRLLLRAVGPSSARRESAHAESRVEIAHFPSPDATEPLAPEAGESPIPRRPSPPPTLLLSRRLRC